MAGERLSRASIPAMTQRTHRHWTGLLLASCLVCGPLAAAELEVRLTPANKTLKDNVEAHIGPLGERDAVALRRFARHAEREARKAL